MIKLLKKIKHLRPQRSAAFLGYAFWIIVFGLGTLSSCTKKPGLVGSKLLSDSALNTTFTDTVTLRTYTEAVDTTITSKQSPVFLGSIHDPVFGRTTAGIYMQLIQAYTGARFGVNPQPDSLVMQFAYNTVFGDTTTPLTLHAYEVEGNLYYDSTYYSDSKVAVYPTDYADYTFIPHASNTIILAAGDTLTHVLRVNLSKYSDALAKKLIQADTTMLDSVDLFKNYFRGLYFTVTPVNSGGGIASFYPRSTNAALTLYYHNDSTDSLQFNFGIGDSCAYFTHIDHDYSTGNPELAKQILQKDTTLGQQQFYVQGLGGLETVIKFPFIKNFARMHKTVSVNEAKLVLPGYETTPLFGAPATLSLIKVASDSSYSILSDQLEGATFFGGSYSSSSNSYTFRITHYIQSLIQDTTQQNLGLMLYVTSNAINPQRFIFNGPKPVNDTLSRAKLELLYTTLPQK